MTEEDRIRRWVIQRLMCHFEVDKREFLREFSINFDAYFSQSRRELVDEGFLCEDEEKLLPTERGRLFIRLIAAHFDAYLKGTNYSRAI